MGWRVMIGGPISLVFDLPAQPEAHDAGAQKCAGEVNYSPNLLAHRSLHRLRLLRQATAQGAGVLLIKKGHVLPE